MSDNDNTEHKAEEQTTTEVEPSEDVESDASTDAKNATEKDAADPAPRRAPRAIPAIPLMLVVALLAAGGLAAWLYFSQFRPDEATDAAASRIAVDAARDGTVAILSYKPDTLDRDFAAAKSHLTGDFLKYYDTFTKDVVTPAAKEKAVTTTAQVVGAATTEMHPKSAVVLVFINQVSTSKERPDPSASASSVLVSLTKVQGTWLINKFDPV